MWWREMLPAWALTPVFLAIAISTLVTLLNGACRALVEQRPIRARDFHHGIGLVLGASGTTLTNLTRTLLSPAATPADALPQALAIPVLLGLLIMNMLFQQEVERRIVGNRPTGWPGWIATALGYLAMVGAIRLGVGSP